MFCGKTRGSCKLDSFVSLGPELPKHRICLLRAPMGLCPVTVPPFEENTPSNGLF